MSYFLCFPAMIFCHVLDDYYLQGILASLKQKDYWTKMNGYSEFYKYDYIVALIFHGFSWSFITLIPVIAFKFDNIPVSIYIFVLLLQAAIHSIVDDLKANKKYINLVQDQIIHMIQIFMSWIVFSIF